MEQEKATIERVARAICSRKGFDPDCKMQMGPAWYGPNGYIVVDPERLYAGWEAFWTEAAEAVKVLQTPPIDKPSEPAP